MWLALIVLHAAAGVLALVAGATAIDPDRARSTPWALPTLVGAVAAMAVFVVGAIAVRWSSHETTTRTVFGGLVVLAGVMTWRAIEAGRLCRRAERAADVRSVDAIGFVLISLFDGFVIVTALDLGAPPWLVVPLAVGAVLVGRRTAHAVRADVAARPSARPVDR